MAAADVQQAFEYYEAQREDLGFRFVEQVEETLLRIQSNPNIYPLQIDDLRRANVQKFPYGVWFRIDLDLSLIVACVHHKRLSKELARQRIRSIGPEPD